MFNLKKMIMRLLKNKIFKNALGICLLLIVYFHTMQLFGLAHIIELRSFNGLFLAGGIFLFLKKLKKEQKQDFNYLTNFFSGFGIGIITSLLFTIYISLYVLVINPVFYAEIIAQEALGSHITMLSVPIVVFIESAASSYLFTYISMQFLKQENSIKSKVVSIASN